MVKSSISGTRAPVPSLRRGAAETPRRGKNLAGRLGSHYREKNSAKRAGAAVLQILSMPEGGQQAPHSASKDSVGPDSAQSQA
jgi:hypothetical protein